MKHVLLSFGLLFCFCASHAQEQWHLVFLNTRPDKPNMEKVQHDSIMKAHMTGLQMLFDQGVATLIGPFEGGGGMMLMKGSQASAIKAKLQQEDPAVKAGFFYVEPMVYEAAGGTAACQVRPDPANLTSLKVIRLDAKKSASKALRGQVETALKSLKEQKKLLQAGWLNQGQSFFMVVRNESKSEIISWLKAFPLGVKSGFQSQIRSWWTTKGAACDGN